MTTEKAQDSAAPMGAASALSAGLERTPSPEYLAFKAAGCDTVADKRRWDAAVLFGQKKQQRDVRNLRTHLKALTDHVMRHLVWLDEEMKKPESPERGKRLAGLANVLDVANDSARYHGLGIDFRKDNKDKERSRVMRSNA